MASWAPDPLSLAGMEPCCCSTWEMFCWTVPQFQEGTLLRVPCCQGLSSPAEGHPFLWACRSRGVTALLQAALSLILCLFCVLWGLLLLSLLSCLVAQLSQAAWTLLGMEGPLAVPPHHPCAPRPCIPCKPNQASSQPPLSAAFSPSSREMRNFSRVGLLFQTIPWERFHAWEFPPLLCGSQVGFSCSWQSQQCLFHRAEVLVLAESLAVGTCFPPAACWLFSAAGCLFPEPVTLEPL